MTDRKRKIHLGAFLQSVGHHLSAWRHPDTRPERAVTLDHFKELARIAEDAKFDAIFFADGLGLPHTSPALLAKVRRSTILNRSFCCRSYPR